MTLQEIETTVRPGTDKYGNISVPESWIGKEVLVHLLPEKSKHAPCTICGAIIPTKVWEENGGVCKSCNDHLELEGY